MVLPSLEALSKMVHDNQAAVANASGVAANATNLKSASKDGRTIGLVEQLPPPAPPLDVGTQVAIAAAMAKMVNDNQAAVANASGEAANATNLKSASKDGKT